MARSDQLDSFANARMVGRVILVQKKPTNRSIDALDRNNSFLVNKHRREISNDEIKSGVSCFSTLHRYI